MKKNTLTKLISLTLALTATLTLTACGGGSSDAGSGSSAGPGSTAPASEEQSTPSPDPAGTTGEQGSDPAGEVTPQAQATTLSQLLSSGETILYRVAGGYDLDQDRLFLKEDCSVKTILVTEPDGSFYQMDLNTPINELAQMSHEEIVEMVKESHKYAYNFSIFRDYQESGTDNMAAQLLGFLEVRLDYKISNCIWSNGTNRPKYDYPPRLPAELTALIGTYIGHINSYFVDCPELEATVSGLDDQISLGLYVEDILDRNWEAEKAGGGMSLEEYISFRFPESCHARTLQLYNDCSAVIDEIAEYISNAEPVPGQYRLMLKTGEDGTPCLRFVGRTPYLFGSEEHGTPETENTTISLAVDTELGGRYQLAGSEYSGLSASSSTGGYPFLVVKGSYDFSLEQPGTSDLPVDVEPDELFG